MTPGVAKCLVLSKVLMADGMVTDDERAYLTAMMEKLGLTEAECAQVTKLEGLNDAEGVVRALPVEERKEMVEMLVDGASADGHLSPLELKVVNRISKALGI